jgi:hypothetical protein
MSRNPIFDANGDKIGNLDFSCTVSDGRGGPTGFLCTNVITLKESLTAAAGTIVATGLYKGGDEDVFAITGGSGAYQDVGGYVVQGEEYTVHLIP